MSCVGLGIILPEGRRNRLRELAVFLPSLMAWQLGIVDFERVLFFPFFKVDNINEAVMDLKKKKIRSLSEEVKIGAHGKPVIFLHPKDCGGVLVELEQA